MSRKHKKRKTKNERTVIFRVSGLLAHVGVDPGDRPVLVVAVVAVLIRMGVRGGVVELQMRVLLTVGRRPG